MMERVGEMTRAELKQLIGELVDERVDRLLAVNGDAPWIRKRAGKVPKRGWLEISAEIDRIGWMPPPGAETPLEMLRADRDR